MTNFSSVLIGDESLLIGCAEHLLDQGHGIRALVTGNVEIRNWGAVRGIPVYAKSAELAEHFEPAAFDWLLSIANLSVIPENILTLPARGAVNFHDGPLPRYAGLNTPAWAILNGEAEHGVTWHLIEGGVDEGDILEQRLFDIGPDDTAFSLNSKCYAAAMESFPALADQLASETRERQAQDLTQRSYFGKYDRPANAGFLDLSKPATELSRLVRALDFGSYRNPLVTAKINLGDQVLIVRHAEADETASTTTPGTVLDVATSGLRVTTGKGVLALSELTDISGRKVDLTALVKAGDSLTHPQAETLTKLDENSRRAAQAEAYWSAQLNTMHPVELALAKPGKSVADWQNRTIELPGEVTTAELATVVLAFACHSSGNPQASVAYVDDGLRSAIQATPGLLSSWVPLQTWGAIADDAHLSDVVQEVTENLARCAQKGPFAADLPLRDPAISALRTPDIALCLGADMPVEGSALTLAKVSGADPLTLHYDTKRLSAEAADLLADRLITSLEVACGKNAGETVFSALTPLPDAERQNLLVNWNQTTADVDLSLTIHRAFEAQVARTPDAIALVYESAELSYSALNARANGLAQLLINQGVGPGSHVGLCVTRGPDLLVGALAILKAGGAYVPLDPAYPKDRLAHYVTDSQASVIITQTDLQGLLPETGASIINMDDHRNASSDSNVDGKATGDDLAYVIYTSGSTGTPKGVMVEHRNVANFFTGMDDVVEHKSGGVWLAVTSLAFDISVLELFYTLARGFKLVLSSDEGRAAISNGPIAGSGRAVDFSLYYWSNDCEAGPNKYELLLEGAKFADANGFDALWTPERHFHAFGGMYPNPSVTGAAVAAVTKNLSVRAGSCVAPLHHPARIAEEWAVIDNLTDGKTGLAIASGWQPDDFVLRPENTPPQNKGAMFETIDQLRRMWRGEPVEFPTQSGEMLPVVTQPRPVSKELALWVTTAGNPETWREAGSVGANILTHLLGQSIEEVGEKISIYHDALRAAGHDPEDFCVTVMLHTMIGQDRDEVAQVVAEPLKDYLRSAAGLIKQYAWAFPAFKKPKGVTNPFQVDLSKLDDAEMDAILDFAFERYFNDAGLFGTVQEGVARVEELKQIGVGEIACLIDYGIPTRDVLDSLPYLAEVREQSNKTIELDNNDFSIAAQILRHGVTHMQSTPSMAQMLTMNDEARHALGQIKHLYLGGEALPGALVDELRRCTRTQITNMYGPTETTIWSATLSVDSACAGLGIVPIGRPIANTSVYVLDAGGNPAPVGAPGELFIGGIGVVRGYWQQDTLTKERFVANPFGNPDGDRLYRTGDLARWRIDGTLEFLGRSDHQVKIRGQRIELGEIEACIATHPAVREAVVIPHETKQGNAELAAYLTTSAQINDEALRQHLQARLPEVMVPRHLMVLDHFPLTPNKKIDRKALPEPQSQTQTKGVAATVSIPSDSGNEAAIAAIWARILGVSNIGNNDSFFDLGGHSLLAVQAHREIRIELEVPQLSITDVFRFPRLKALAAHLDTLTGKGGEAVKPGTPTVPTPMETQTMSKRRAMRAARKRHTG